MAITVAALRMMISIHALLAESDLGGVKIGSNITVFLSTLSLRRATRISLDGIGVILISIHALLAESDFFTAAPPFRHENFYPRSPCGERPGQLGGQRQPPAISIHALLAESDFCKVAGNAFGRGFLSTLSLRRATPCCKPLLPTCLFLSTLSLRRATINAVVH